MTSKLGNWFYACRTAAKSLVLGANLSSLRLMLRPMDWYYYCNASLFLRDTCFGLRGLPQRNIWEVVPGINEDVEVTLPSIHDAWGWNDPAFAVDLLALAILCRAIHPRKVFEIGTFKGYTSLLFAMNSDPSVEVFTLDLPPNAGPEVRNGLTVRDLTLMEEGQQSSTCFESHPLGNRIQRLWGDSAAYDFAPYYQEIDLFFVDGAHTYDYVRKDTENALRCVRDGGAIAWHDYGRRGLSRGVSQWLNELGGYCQVFSCPGSSVAFMHCTPENVSSAHKYLGITRRTRVEAFALQ